MSVDQILWCERYRPNTVQECILPKELKDVFQKYVDIKEIPNLLLSGNPGTGKTSLAKALCNEVGCDYLFLNASTENGIDVLRNQITNYATSVSISGGRKVVILDESDGLSPQFLNGAKNFLETFSKNCSFIFTCNHKNKIIDPIHSRCAVIDFKINKEDKPKLMAQFMKRICHILELENIEYSKEVIAQLIAKYYPDNRRILNELQRYSTSGKIDVGILSQINDANIAPLIESLKKKNFSDVRKWVFENSDLDSSSFFRKFYDNCYEFLKPVSIPQLVLLLGKYQYQSAFVADQELNNISFLVECMVELEFK